MAADLVIKKGDAGKVITGQFKDANGVAVNCTGSTTRKIFMKRSGTLKINSTFTFDDEATGLWRYVLTAGDLDTAGTYHMELEVTLPGPQVLTFPTNEANPYIVVAIKKDLG